MAVIPPVHLLKQLWWLSGATCGCHGFASSVGLALHYSCFVFVLAGCSHSPEEGTHTREEKQLIQEHGAAGKQGTLPCDNNPVSEASSPVLGTAIAAQGCQLSLFRNSANGLHYFFKQASEIRLLNRARGTSAARDCHMV